MKTKNQLADMSTMGLLWVIFSIGFVFTVLGCHPGIQEDVVKKEPLEKLRPGSYPAFLDNHGFEGLTASIDNSLIYFKRVPLDRSYTYGKEVYTAAHMIRSLETFKAFLGQSPSAKEVNAFIKSNFNVYAAAGNQDGEVLFTGYYEPTYEGSLNKSHIYPYPVYSRPDDLLEIDLTGFSDKYKGHRRLMARVNLEKKRVVPYFSREQINAINDFPQRAQVVVWLKSRVDRFFLEVQGSGRVVLDSGNIIRVHYAGSNGNAYRSIGRYLINKNEIAKADMSMQAIRAWLEMHPDRMDEVLHVNHSFVFFKKEDGGPYGSLSVEVSAFRSIATDSRLFPKGALCFVQAQLPDRVNVNPVKTWENASFFVLNQDTGGAIKGPGRADIFCGNDSYGEYTAGHMNTYGRLYFIVLKNDDR